MGAKFSKYIQANITRGGPNIFVLVGCKIGSYYRLLYWRYEAMLAYYFTQKQGYKFNESWVLARQ